LKKITTLVDEHRKEKHEAIFDIITSCTQDKFDDGTIEEE